MGASESKMFRLKVFVDKEEKRVVFAESDKDFVDVLFSFLTLPIGTILRLVRKQSQPKEIGCLNALYQGLENLDVRHLQTERCKDLLLHPRNSTEAHCRKLKLNVDDAEPTKYYTCSSYKICKEDNRLIVSTFQYEKCICGYLMRSEVKVDVNDVDTSAGGDGGVFVKGAEMFIITDDLQVMPMSTATSLAVLKNLGILDMTILEEKTLNVGLEEVLCLLRLSLLSKTPLTSALLLKGGDTSGVVKLEPEDVVQSPRRGDLDTASNIEKMTLKVLLSMSKKKALYAEAEEDFVNFLFSLLTFPVGAVVKLLNRSPSLGCIANLYKSVEGLNVDRYMKSVDLKSMLLSPKIAPLLGWKNQPLGVVEALHPHLGGSIPKCLDTTSEGGFVRGRAKYMVTDDLVVTPLSPISTVSLLNKLQVPISDLEEREVSVGQDEALRLLKASLISKSALNNAFNFNSSLKKPKQEKRGFKSANTGITLIK